MSSGTSVGTQRILLASAFALVSERCRNAYMHDLKGGLQSLHSALELMSRSAGAPVAGPSPTTKVAALAKRALAKHESELLTFSLQTTPSSEARGLLDLSALVPQIVQFLGHDALTRSLITQTHVANDVSVFVEAYQCRMLVLGLCVTSMDVMPAGSIFKTAVYKQGDLACVEVPSLANFIPVQSQVDASAHFGTTMSAHEILLSVAAGWAADRGGSVCLQATPAGRCALLRLPIVADPPTR